MIKDLQHKNPTLNILSIHDPSFNRYGKVLDVNGFKDILNYLSNETEVPKLDNYYIAHDPKLEASVHDFTHINNVFGNMPLEFGYVNGNNTKLNALEYHKSSEINITNSPIILMLARTEDLVDNTLQTSQVAVFFVPENTAIEIFSQTLHFSPCKVNDLGFKCGVILPFGTNMEFINHKTYTTDEDALLFKTNKWIIVHSEHKKFIDLGAYNGLIGTNIEIKY